VLELDGTNANAYFNRGSTHDSLGAYDKAIADYSRALDLDRQAQLAASGSSAAAAGAGGGPASAAALSSPPGPAAPAPASRGGTASPGAGTPWKQPQQH
jgi:tetratricopeptide (TPR) repeat protein